MSIYTKLLVLFLSVGWVKVDADGVQNDKFHYYLFMRTKAQYKCLKQSKGNEIIKII